MSFCRAVIRAQRRRLGQAKPSTRGQINRRHLARSRWQWTEPCGCIVQFTLHATKGWRRDAIGHVHRDPPLERAP